MLERGYGKVVNIAIVRSGITVFPGFRVADGMSKAALAYLTRTTPVATSTWAPRKTGWCGTCPR